MPMGVTEHPLCYTLQSGLSYQRRFPVVYLTFKAMRRPRLVDKQLEVCAFYCTNNFNNLYIMALIDVIKCPMEDDDLCLKFPSEDLRMGSQLIVYPSQVALFVKGGQIFDEFLPGTYTLQTSNIPLLNKIINLPFGGETPFKAEVWFINLTSKLDMKWGTPTPIQLEDPKYNIIIPVRAFGQYGLKVNDPQLFLKTLIGNMPSFSAEKVDTYFKGKLLSQLSVAIANKMTCDDISILEINSHLMDLSEYCNESINQYFKKYGLELQDFSIISINVPQDDPSIIKLKEAKDLAARLKITGRDIYQMERSFDVLEGAANNQAIGGQMVGVGMGVGVGASIGAQVGAVAGNVMNTNPMAPPSIPQQMYYIYVNGQQIGGQTISMIKQLIMQGSVTPNTLVWTQGLANWLPAAQIPDLALLFTTPPPMATPPVPPVQ